MVDINSIERALLVNVIKQEKWDILILNDITEQYFTEANKPLYRHIRDYINTSKYPDLQIISYEYKITDDEMASYLSIQDIQGLCETLKKEFLKDELKYQLSQLNNKSDLMYKDPASYISAMEDVCGNLRTLSFKSRTVGLFDNIEEILKIDANDVISTGFTELDEKLIGFKRGEELVVFLARTGQGKSWMGLKFALSAALKGERVGIYSRRDESATITRKNIMLCKTELYRY